MKKIFAYLSISSLLICLSPMLKAQGNLQFNRAINNNYTLPVTGSQSSGGTGLGTNSFTITVPAGKVWKLEACSMSGYNNTSPNYPFMPSGTESCVVAIDLGVVCSNGSAFTGPLWLAAGTHIVTMTGTASNTPASYTFNANLTGIEFNITQ